MKIKEFSIIKYGPLKSVGPTTLSDNFTLLSGQNEAGKSLTVDALTKFLLKKKTKDFGEIERVEEKPEGYLSLEINNETKKLPEQGTIYEISKLTASEYRNIFIIRDSDLSIKEEENFLTKVTDKLTGLKTSLIQDLKESIRDVARITPSGKLKNTKEKNKLRERVEEAENLIKKIEELIKELKEENYEEIENDLIKLKNKKEEIEDKLERLEIARKKEKFIKAKNAFSKIKEKKKEQEELNKYNEEEWQRWRDATLEKERIEDELKELKEKVERNRDKEEELKEKKKEVERELHSLGSQKKRIGQLKPVFYISSILSSILTVISFVLWFTTSIELLFFSTLILGAISVSIILGGLFLVVYNKRKTEELDIKKEKKISKKEKELEQLKLEKSKYEDRVQNNEKDIKRKKKDKKEIERKIESFKKKSKEENLENYKEKLNKKQKISDKIKEAKTILSQAFGEKELKEWEKEIENYKEFNKKEPGINYKESKVQEFKKEKEKLVEKIEDKKERMAQFEDDIEEIERKANRALDMKDDFYYCDTFSDLKEIKNKLNKFIKKTDKERENAIEVIEILKEMESEEKKKIAELFGKDSVASKYFNKITGGEYKEVTFNEEKGAIEVKNKKGEVLEASKLSGGAHDQLYFSIRIALAEKLLEKEKGFFIMDDPFIKSDLRRLKTQLKILKDISFKLGWQILYFTAKGEELEEGTTGEIKSLLKEDIQKNKIKHIQIK